MICDVVNKTTDVRILHEFLLLLGHRCSGVEKTVTQAFNVFMRSSHEIAAVDYGNLANQAYDFVLM